MFNQSRLQLQKLIILLFIISLGACSSLVSLTPNYNSTSTSNSPNDTASATNTIVAQSLARSETTSTSSIPTPIPSISPTVANASYLGKLNLQIIADEQNKKSFNLDFELQGNARQGQFDLMGPFGAQLAQLQWSANSASLRQGKKEQSGDNLNALLQPLLGFEFPLQAIFSWLEKNNIQDLQNLAWSAQEFPIASGKRALRLEQKFPKIFNPPETSANQVANTSFNSSAFTTVKVLLILNQPETPVAQ